MLRRYLYENMRSMLNGCSTIIVIVVIFIIIIGYYQHHCNNTSTTIYYFCTAYSRTKILKLLVLRRPQYKNFLFHQVQHRMMLLLCRTEPWYDILLKVLADQEDQIQLRERHIILCWAKVLRRMGLLSDQTALHGLQTEVSMLLCVLILLLKRLEYIHRFWLW